MEKIELLETIFDNFIEEITLEKTQLISSIKNNKYNLDRYKNCSRIKTIVAHLFFMSILKDSPENSNVINEKDPFVQYIRWHSVIVKQFDQNVLPCSFRNKYEKENQNSKEIKLHSVKTEAKKLFWNSLENLNAAKCLRLNEFFSQSVHYSQSAAELAIKSVLKAKKISHDLWRSEHSIVRLGNYLGCFDKKFISLCSNLENVGLNKWKTTFFEKSSTLSIRSRYCDYDENSTFYLDTLPVTVFNYKLAKKAYIFSEKISFYCESLLNETWKPVK